MQQYVKVIDQLQKIQQYVKVINPNKASKKPPVKKTSGLIDSRCKLTSI